MEKLKNSGIEFIGDFNSEEKTIVVVGVARSGTSLVAGVLDKIGVFTGEKSKSPVFEDIKLSTAIENDNEELIDKIIESYNKKYKVWAFKRPSIVKYLEKMHSKWRNPYYIFIFKDVVSIANRNKISMNMNFLENMFYVYNEIGKIVDFIRNNRENINGMFLSYEKVINKPEDFLTNLLKVIKIDISDIKRKEVLNFISPDPVEYLDKTRITKAVGRVDLVSAKKVTGWAKWMYKNEPAEVCLMINDKTVLKTKADKMRKDLKIKKIHPNGECGFEFFLEERLKPYDKLEVKVVNEVKALEFSMKAKKFFIKGNVDRIYKRKIIGWAFYGNQTAEVQLFVNNRLVLSKKADMFRRDLKEKGVHYTGKCGFEIKLDFDLLPDNNVVLKVGEVELPFGEKAKEFFREKNQVI